MAVTEQHQPNEAQINGDRQPPITSENVIPRRQRRPSVRLGEIGDQPASALTKNNNNNKPSRTRPLTNLGSFEGEEERENLDNLAIGSWKIKGSKSKRVRTNWVSKFDEGGSHNFNNIDGFDRDFEMEEHSPNGSMENDKHLNFWVPQNSRAKNVDDMVELDDHNGGQSARGWGRDDDVNNVGVRVWLNGLGLGRYWPVFEIHEVDEEVLPMLTLEDLKDMGINAVGSRRKMFCAIQKLSKVFS